MSLPLLMWLAAIPAQPVDAPTAKTEMLGIDVPDEFQVGYHARNQAMEILELIEPPETVESWSRMITSQMIFDGAKDGGLESYHARWRTDLQRACPGMRETAVRGTVDGRPAKLISVACPKMARTGQAEAFTAFLVEGQANLMIAQVAFRPPVTGPDDALIERIRGSLKVCDERTLSSCSARKATGFLARD